MESWHDHIRSLQEDALILKIMNYFLADPEFVVNVYIMLSKMYGLSCSATDKYGIVQVGLRIHKQCQAHFGKVVHELLIALKLLKLN